MSMTKNELKDFNMVLFNARGQQKKNIQKETEYSPDRVAQLVISTMAVQDKEVVTGSVEREIGGGI